MQKVRHWICSTKYLDIDKNSGVDTKKPFWYAFYEQDLRSDEDINTAYTWSMYLDIELSFYTDIWYEPVEMQQEHIQNFDERYTLWM